jgi:hypothetical protein
MGLSINGHHKAIGRNGFADFLRDVDWPDLLAKQHYRWDEKK